jgi:class 3 adenylate cyclase
MRNGWYASAIMAGEVRYTTTSDGVRIAYRVEGEGPPLLVVSSTFAAFSLLQELPSYSRLLARIGEGRTLVRFDTRGIGLSQREITSARSNALVLDPLAVMDALGIDRLSGFAGGAMGGPLLQLAVDHPHRVAALLLFGSRPRVTNQQWSQAMILMLRGSWEAASRTMAGGNLRHSPEDASKLASIYLRSIAGDVAARYIDDNMDWDVTSGLKNITARTLIMHSLEDALHRFSLGEELAAGIRGARLLPIEGNYSVLSLGDKTDFVAAAINSFLDEDPETRAISVVSHDETHVGGLRTVLFTDLVGHTEMMSRLGDEAGRAVLREHERITREVLKQHGGAEVKTMGDGFMASFGSVTKAVECAVALQKGIADREGEPLSIRVGLNAGEPIEEEGDLFGASVILASRIAAKAAGGEILVANAVRELSTGKGFFFSDRGEFVAKGFDEPIRVYEVQWRH